MATLRLRAGINLGNVGEQHGSDDWVAIFDGYLVIIRTLAIASNISGPRSDEQAQGNAEWVDLREPADIS